MPPLFERLNEISKGLELRTLQITKNEKALKKHEANLDELTIVWSQEE